MTKTYDYITTYSGLSFNFLNPEPNQIYIQDIARALSMNCRFNGHVKRFYSVAEHSIILHDYVLKQTRDKQLAFDALMHDASEAYICDIPRPIKPHLSNYQEIEKNIEKAIQDKFGNRPMSDYLKDLDHRIVADEAAQLFLNVPGWVGDVEKIGVDVRGCHHGRAFSNFLSRFHVFKKSD